MKIIDIRKTQSQGWVADVMLSPLSILPVSIPVLKCDPYALMEYVASDPLHDNVVIKHRNIILDITAIGRNIKSYSDVLKSRIDNRMNTARQRARECFSH